MHYAYLDSPIGRLLVAGDALGLRHILFASEDQARAIQPDWRPDRRLLAEALHQLDAWFDGRRRHFDLPLAATGTPFRRRVWAELVRIPHGTAISYGELARRIGQPRASRAVGAANGANPLPIVVPCHRVIGADGRLTGFGGGLPVKRWLLEHEQRWLGPD